MARAVEFLAALAAFAVLAVSSALPAADKPLSEKEKIEALIKHVEGLTDAKFVRNDTEYDAKSAGKFLRAKWRSGASEIATARDFIEKAGSVSSSSGKPYLIRFEGGKEVKSGEYLTAELKKLEAK